MHEVQLSEELINQVQTLAQYEITEPNSYNQIKFDAKGTLHVMHRDMDGKLLKDIPIKESYLGGSSELSERREECSAIQKQAKRMNILFGCVLGFLGVLMILAIGVLSLLV